MLSARSADTDSSFKIKDNSYIFCVVIRKDILIKNLNTKKLKLKTHRKHIT